MSVRRRLSVLSVLLALPALAGPLLARTPASAAPATVHEPAVQSTGSSFCHAPGVEWRVDHETRDSAYGPVLTATGLFRRAPGGTWTNVSTQTWQLRWLRFPNGGMEQLEGNLSALADRPVALFLTPRFVAPDGSCTVYTVPFGNGQAGQPKIGVLGDSLTGSLNSPEYNEDHPQGFVQGNLNAQGRRAEVEGQGGRRWIASPELTGLARGNNHLLDEARGLLRHGPHGLVVALGANDAGQRAWLPTEADRTERLTYTINGIRAFLTEMRAANVCVSLVTTPDNAANYWGAPPLLYAQGAQLINQELRAQANASTTDRIHLQDFAALSWDHHTYQTENPVWFGSDDLHLNDVGRVVYTAQLVDAALKCG